MNTLRSILNKAAEGERLTASEARGLINIEDPALLLQAAARLRDLGHGDRITYSPKVIVPLTRFCQQEWDFCALGNPPRHGAKTYLGEQDILAIAERGKRAGCKEMLFFLAARPGAWSPEARDELHGMGYESTPAYMAAMADKVFEQTGLLPKLHSYVTTRDELKALRKVSVGQGLMLDSRAEYISPDDKSDYDEGYSHPHIRLGVAAAAGALDIPFTSGLVIGIGENRQERVDILLALRELDDTYGHLQEVVIQDYRSRALNRGKRISRSMLDEMLWTVAVARLLFGPTANIQAPADFPLAALGLLLQAGVSDWGGMAPPNLTPVNGDIVWPQLEQIRLLTESNHKGLVQRLPLYAEYASLSERWTDDRFHGAINSQQSTIEGLGKPLMTLNPHTASVNR